MTDLITGQQLQQVSGQLNGNGLSNSLRHVDLLGSVRLHLSETPSLLQLQSGARTVKTKLPPVGSVPNLASPDHMAC